MAKRTIRRTAQSVSAPSLSEQYFNFSSFGGINDNKNYVDVSQYSFEDANNMYVDQDSQLHTRPPVKEYHLTILNDDEYCVNMTKINNVTFYHTVENGTYRWRWKYNDTWYESAATEKSLVMFVNDMYIVFNEDAIYGYRWNFEESKFDTYTAEDLVYVPITTVIYGTSTEENESLNLFTTSYITRYLFENSSDVQTNYVKLLGQTVTVVIDEEEYTFTFQSGNDIVFVSPLGELDIVFANAEQAARNIQSTISIAGDSESSTSQKVILIDADTDDGDFYLSVDGLLFTRYTFPTDFDFTMRDWHHYCLCLSDDGSTVWLAQANISNDDDGTHATIWSMGVPFISNYYSWQSEVIDLLPASASTSDGASYNAYRRSGGSSAADEAESRSYSIVGGLENAMNVSVSIHSPDGNHVAIAWIADTTITQYNNGTEADETNYVSTSYSTSGTSSTFSVPMIHFAVINEDVDNRVAVGHSLIQNFRSTTEALGTSSGLMPYLTDSGMTFKLRYVVDNSLAILLLTCRTYYTEYYIYDYVGSYKTFYVNGIYYCVISSDNSPHYCFGAAAPEANASYNFWNTANYWPETLCVAPMYFNILYSFNDISNSNYYEGDLSISNEDMYTRFNYLHDIFAIFQDGYLYVKFCGMFYDASYNYYFNIYNFNHSEEFYLISDYDSSEYSFRYTFARNSAVDCRYNYPYTFYNLASGLSTTISNYESSYTINATTLESSSSYFSNYGRFAKIYDIADANNNLLTMTYYYYNGIQYPLLKNDNDVYYPIYVSDEGYEFLYWNNTESKVYTNQYEVTAYIDILTEGEYTYCVPSFYEDFITTTIAIDNLLYQSITRLDEEDDYPKIYFPEDSEVRFIDKITNFVIFSTTSLGVFLENLVYEYSYSSDNDYYTLAPTKLQLGCKEGADIITSYDGATIYVTNIKGLASLSYEDFVQSDEQVYEYLTENIMSLYDSFRGDNKIKLYQYKDWLWMYRQDSTEVYLYDTRTSTWWKWTLPYAIQKLLYNEDELIFLQSDNRLATFKFDDDTNFSDFVGTEIEWHFRSQKLHLSYPNHYKHINQLNIITAQDGVELRYKLKFINYHNLYRLSDTDTVCFDIDQLSTLIKRVNFMKTNAFQFEIANDPTDNNPKHFETPDIVIKYRITEAIR